MSHIAEKINNLGHLIETLSKTQDTRWMQLEEKYAHNERKIHHLEENMIKSAARPSYISSVENDDPHYKAFFDYVKNPHHTPTLQMKSSTHGDLLLPTHTESVLTHRLAELSAVRSCASVVNIDTLAYDMFMCQTMPVTWGENTTEKHTFDPRKITFKTHMHHMKIMIPANWHDFSPHQLHEWITNKASHDFAAAENQAFITGDGISQPQGILSAPLSHNGEENHIHVHAVKDFSFNSQLLDTLYDLMGMLHPAYCHNARWMMQRNTFFNLAKLKNKNGDYLCAINGQQPTLLGYPVTWCNTMPAAQINNVPILFGDFSEAYVIVDSQQTTAIVDAYTCKPHVELCLYKRVGGGWKNHDAMKGLLITS